MIDSSKLAEHDPREGGVDEETQAVNYEIQQLISFGSFQEDLTFHFRIIIKYRLFGLNILLFAFIW